jgi:iron complex outermembrane recepter protein
MGSKHTLRKLSTAMACALGAILTPVGAQETSGAGVPGESSRAAAQGPSEQGEPHRATPTEELAVIPVPAKPDEAAASTPSEAPRRSIQIEEVIVTARRVEESQQDVPVAISAVSGEDLRRDQINSPSDLNGRIPSLVVGTGAQMRNTETPTIRGQGAQFGASPGVVVYLAEVALPSDPIASYQGGPGKFFDLANVQVLKGSQGTLFGRNTTGGALLLEPAKPAEQFGMSLRAGLTHMSGEKGDDLAGQSYEGVFNLPLGDTLRARLGGQVYGRDGFTKDVATGKDYDDKNYWTARFGLTWQPLERLENYFLANYSDADDNGTATVVERINREGLNRAIPWAVGLGPVTGLPGVDLSQPLNLGCVLLNVYGPSSNCGQDILDEQAARGNRRVQLSGDPHDRLESGLFVDKLAFQLTDTLTLRNIASYSTLDHWYRWDLDGSRASFNEFINPDDVKSSEVRTVIEELQLQGSALGGDLSFVLGGYYERTEAEGRFLAKSLLFVDVDQGYAQTKKSYAPFFQGTYNLGGMVDSLEGLSLTLGARYTKDKAAGSAYIQQVASGLFPLVDKSFYTEVESAELTYTAGLDYKFAGSMIYGKVSRGYKTGGISTIAVNPDHYTFEPEYVLNYELGQKSDFAIGEVPVRLNTSVYYTDYSDMQASAADAYVDPDNPSPVAQLGQAIFNVGRAWVAGFEVDLIAQPFDDLTLLATYGYTDAGYDEFGYTYFGATPQLDCTGQEIPSGGELELTCLTFRTTPRNQYSVSLRYSLPLAPSIGRVEASASYVWVDEQYSSQTTLPEGEPGAWLPAFGLINASIHWSGLFGSRLGVQLYGTNLANKEYRISNSNQWNFTYVQSSMYSEPRNVGLQLSYDWE